MNESSVRTRNFLPSATVYSSLRVACIGLASFAPRKSLPACRQAGLQTFGKKFLIVCSQKLSLSKLISSVVLISFIFTSIPIRGYAQMTVYDSLRKPSAVKDGGADSIIKDLKEDDATQKDGNTVKRSVGDQRPVWEKDLKDAKKAKQIKVHQFAKEVLEDEDLWPGSTFLSLGCGVGLDEISFAKAGHIVVATDFVESTTPVQ